MIDELSYTTLESMSQAVWYNQWTLNLFKNYLKGKILEVGCGIGNFTKTLSSFGTVWAIDINKNYLDQTKKMVNNKVKVGFGNIEKGEYFFEREKFNSIVCINVLEHLENDEKTLRNLHKLLTSRGVLVLLVPSHKILYGEIDKSIGHFRRYSKSEIVSKLEKAGFEFINIRRINFLGAIGWFLAGKVFTQSVVGKHEIKIFNLVGPLVLSVENLIEPPFGTSMLIIASKKI